VVSNIKRREFILYLYDQLSQCETEDEAEAMVKLIDHEESFLQPAPLKGRTLLDDLEMKPLPPWGS
jgi:hypothetical protein